ncbi:precorrin-6y C5,15-methyltransferase (decarboxylating) subunit CbiE [Actinoallomurus sp. CA-150999]|uniref:precorrin-6y C5,15-methyltransferase (decarboxylating) subunit CbiE n=1 Tax=Actinoallomurus sp. CA-150999 TaxID=3239887 RepID=UPI003D8BCEA1
MITVVGYDGSPLPQTAMDRLQKASLVVGGRRHLEAVRPPEHARRIVLGDVPAALAEIDAAAGDDVVVLASGDPGFFGILRSLREHGHAPEALPAVSSVAAAFARIGLPWEDAVVVSAHGRDPRTAVNACRAMPKVAVLTSPACGPGEIGAELAGWDRVLWVAERLGGPEERVVRCTPAEAATRDWSDPNLVIALDEHRLGAGRAIPSDAGSHTGPGRAAAAGRTEAVGGMDTAGRAVAAGRTDMAGRMDADRAEAGRTNAAGRTAGGSPDGPDALGRPGGDALNGSALNGLALNGSALNGSAQDGSAQDRLAQDGLAHRTGRRVHDQPAAPPDGWAYADDTYEHRAGMITKWEVRAVVLSRLRPTLGTLIWDVGAGSGSVGVECAEHHAAVIAIERDPAACELIRRNARSTGVRIVEGAAPEAYDGLPDPDAVFVGGGGLDALSGALARRPETAVATFAAVDRAATARRLLADAGYAVEGVQLAASRFADLPGGSFRLDAQNPVFVLTGRLR